MPEKSLHHTDRMPPSRPRLHTPRDLEAYASWKHTVPPWPRRIIEGSMLGRTPVVSKELTPLYRQALQGMQELLQNPELDVSTLQTVSDPRVTSKLRAMQWVEEGERMVNTFQVLGSSQVSFAQKLQWYESQVRSRLQWLQRQDQVDPNSEIDLLPHESSKTLTPSMDEMEKAGEEVREGFFEITPFFGGYYEEDIFEHWEGQALVWQQGQKTLKRYNAQTPPVAIYQETCRTLRTALTPGKRSGIALPTGWVVDTSKEFPETIHLYTDQDGRWYAETQKQEAHTITLPIAKAVQVYHTAPATTVSASSAQLPPEALAAIKDIQAHTPIHRARKLCGWVRDTFTYSNDNQYNQIYRANPASYFLSMWQHKQADCDVANTFAAELLRQAGCVVQMMGGHYVKSPGSNGAAILHGGTGHAWLRVWDPEHSQWVRLDATPKGDPNMDEEEQEQDLEGEQGEGDWGEQEDEILSEEELELLREQVQKQEAVDNVLSREVTYAQQAGCTPAEAKQVLDMIDRLRNLPVAAEMRKLWQKVVRKNLILETEYTGPVPLSESDDITEMAELYIEGVRAKNPDPAVSEKPKVVLREEKSFGGFEVYLAADLSGSMGRTDPKSKLIKKDVQRDALFLYVDTLMSNALHAQQKYGAGKRAGTLRNPMPVRVSVVSFGEEIQTLLPITEQWGPAEQIRLYHALDQCTGGSTPDHEALQLIHRQILQSKTQDNPRYPLHRFVEVFADGDSDSPQSVGAALRALEQDQVAVHATGVTAAGGRVTSNYTDGHVVDNLHELAEKSLTPLVQKLKAWYDI